MDGCFISFKLTKEEFEPQGGRRRLTKQPGAAILQAAGAQTGTASSAERSLSRADA